MFQILITNRYKILISVFVLFTAVLYQDTLQHYYSTYIKSRHLNNGNSRTGIFTEESLTKYNGLQKKKMYLSVLGVIYDVSVGKQHYAKGSPYHYFVGKDGSRALVTGDFQNESENKDHVLDLSCNDILSLLKWRESLEKKYKTVGFLDGRYYDSHGKNTVYLTEFNNKIELCLKEKEQEKQQLLQYPPCNVAWSEDGGTKVWCTKSSGGVHRDWVGVPRQLYTPGEQRPKCICINIDKEEDSTMKFKEYENCANTSAVCFVNSS